MTAATVSPEIASVLRKPLHAVVGLNRPGAPPHLSVVWFDWDGSTFRLSTTRSRLKFRLLRADSRMSMLVDDAEDRRYVVGYGRGRVEEHGHAQLSRRLFARYLPGEDPGDRPDDPDRVVIALTPDRLSIGS